MIEHSARPEENCTLITNKNKDTLEVIMGYLCTIENINKWKIILNKDTDLDEVIENLYPTDNDELVTLGVKTFKVGELSKLVRTRVFAIKNESADANEIAVDLEAVIVHIISVNAGKSAMDIKFGILYNDDYENICKLIKCVMETHGITKYEIFVYNGIES